MKKQRKIALMKTSSILYSSLIYLFLYLPIIVIIVFSFNTSKLNVTFEGFTVEWYSKLFRNTALLKAFGNTMIVAISSTILSSVIGTFAAIGMSRYKFKGKGAIDALLYVPVVIPEIVLGIALLGTFSLAQVPLGLISLVIAHTTFCIPFVVFTLRARLDGYDRSVEEAAMDLGANRKRVFWHITMPILLPGVLNGAILAFTLSIDDVIISYFTNGPSSTTYPLKVWELVKSGVSPDVNALSTLIILGTLIIVIIMQSRNFKTIDKKNQIQRRI